MKKPQYEILDIPFPETAALERQVIADVIQSPDMMGDVLPLIHIDFFTNTERRGIWELLTDHYNKGLSFDMQTITAEIGKPFIDEILPHLPDAGGSISVIQHTNLLRTGAARRPQQQTISLPLRSTYSRASVSLQETTRSSATSFFRVSRQHPEAFRRLR